MDAKRFFTDIKLVPVVTLEHHENAVDLALCLRDAGIRAIEVTLRTEAALKAIELIAEAVPDIRQCSFNGTDYGDQRAGG